MENSKIISRSLLHALGVVAYVVVVAWIMMNAGPLVGPVVPTILAPVSFLLLFVVSGSRGGPFDFCYASDDVSGWAKERSA